MTVVVSWQSVFPSPESSDAETHLLRQLVSFSISQRLADDPDCDRMQELLLNSNGQGYELFAELGERFSTHLELHVLLAEICERSGWFEEAAFHLRVALMLQPRRVDLRHRRGRILGFELHRVGPALVELRTALIGSARPDRQLAVDLARLQLGSGDLRGAYETAEIYRLADPFEPFAAAVLAVCAAHRGDRASSRWFANQAAGLLRDARYLDHADIAEVTELLGIAVPQAPMRARRLSQSA